MRKCRVSSIKILWRYLKLLKKRLWLFTFAIVGMTIFSALFDVIGSLLLKNVFEIAQSGNIEQLYSKLVINVIVGALSLLASVSCMYVYNSQAKRGSLAVKSMLYKKTMRLPISFYDTHHSGQILSMIIYDSETASQIYTSRLRRVIAPILTVFVYLFAMIWLNPYMTVVLLLVNIILFIANALFSKPMKAVGKSMSENNAKMTEKLSNLISGIEISKIYDSNHTLVNKYKAANKEYVKDQKKRMILGGLLDSFNVGFDLICALLFLVIGILFIQKFHTSIGNVAAIYTMYGALSARFLQLGRYYPELMNCIAYAERVFSYINQPEETDYISIKQESRIDISKIVDKHRIYAIEVEGMSFCYDEYHRILNRKSLRIQNGKNTALTGKSGCGKSTLAKLILGFYPMNAGDIKLYGYSVKDIGIHNARKLIAYVPQEPYLFEVSIIENIRYGRLNATDKEVIAAAKMANAHAFIQKQSEGYHTIVSNRGLSLSGGERQRIAIARAILKEATIMIFDEATSALDNESERLILDAISKLKNHKTIITIAHRTATIDMADVEVVI